jgi:uncharacterized protein
MKLSITERKEFLQHLNGLLSNEKVLEMNQYIQHGNTTTFTHCLVVAYYSYLLSLRLSLPLDRRSLVRGAMLHDFYLYDWHVPDKSHKLHGFVHPYFALHNAHKYFKLNKIEADIIEKHMWPLTLRKLPSHKEAILVNLVDKYCSLLETLYLPITPKDYKHILRALSSVKIA